MQPKLRALFFDFDGVILDSVPTKTKAFQILFGDYPTEIIEKVLEHHRMHGGISRVEKIAHAHAHFIGTPLSEQELEKWATRFSALVIEEVIGSNWIEGAREYLEHIRNSELKVFVISGTPQDELRYIIEKKGLKDIFHEQLGSPIKKPAHITTLLKRYQLRPADCVFIGDAFTDYDAAKDTGLHFIGIQGDVTFPDDTIVLPNCCGLETAINDMFKTR
ncbi:MAG: HAD family hydrolase [Desulfobulbaceae bacterium]|nr:MAG: HAD family hydrolase [Desulfobulbaceae bacterium]